ncbi:PH domain-containing protein [Sanguibacter suaedae]|uniref:PH domain-containing protein n=1 Tax=Sanguibacter suaedae TaxID=2795737 RepID=A0A934I8M2_9MICO|nr:PH domain-containing protein [Sanguibacter suaedae]MBI9116236.1 PH domain-containing protein [Sanguibacter suaedae]
MSTGAPLPPEPSPGAPVTAGLPDGKDTAPDAQADLEWRRLHPVTPLVRGWAVIAVAIFFFGQQSVEGMAAGEGAGLPTDSWLLVVGGLLAVGLVVGLFSWLSWRMMRYAYDADAVHVHSGILFRQQRKVRLDRLQAIDVVKPLLARFFGLAELKLEVAGGLDSGVKLGFLRDADAARLRNALLARAAGAVEEDGSAPVVEAPERQVLDLPVGRLVGSLLLSVAAILLLLAAVGAVVATVVSGNVGVLAPLVPGIIGVGAFLGGRFTGDFGFTGAISPDGIRLRRGLLETRSQTIPPGRVQAIRLRQGVLWRRFDWWRVEVNVAGYGLDMGSTTQASTVLLPVGTRDDALRALWLVLPDLGTEDPTSVLHAAMSGSGEDHGFTTSPRSARWLDPLSWSRNGFAVLGRGLLIRRGRLVRSVVMVPHERTQSIGVTQGPLQRRLDVGTVVLHSTTGPVIPQVVHLAVHDAGVLVRDQAERARDARKHAGPERWMEALAVGEAIPEAGVPEAEPLARVAAPQPDESPVPPAPGPVGEAPR